MSQVKLRFSPLLAELLDPRAGFHNPDQYKVFLSLCAAGPVTQSDVYVHTALLNAWNDRFFAEQIHLKEDPQHYASEDMQKCFAKALFRFTDHLPQALQELTNGWRRSLIFNPPSARELLIKMFDKAVAEDEPNQEALRALIHFADRLLVDSEHEADFNATIERAQKRVLVYSI